MDPISAITVLVIMVAVTFISGYGYVWLLFDEYENTEKLVLSGVLGFTQIIFIYFMIKTFTVLSNAVIILFAVEILVVGYKWTKIKN
jgi:hypothetical protein